MTGRSRRARTKVARYEAEVPWDSAALKKAMRLSLEESQKSHSRPARSVKSGTMGHAAETADAPLREPLRTAPVKRSRPANKNVVQTPPEHTVSREPIVAQPVKKRVRTDQRVTALSEARADVAWDGFQHQQAPVFHPTMQEFENPLEYINTLSPVIRKTGIARIVPPKEWERPCVDLDFSSFRLGTKRQRIDQLWKRDPVQKKRGNKENEAKPMGMGFGYGTGKTYEFFEFQEVADAFKRAWFDMSEGGDVNGVDAEVIESQYWGVVSRDPRYNKTRKAVVVEYGSDLDVSTVGSPFPADVESPWDLSRLPVLSESLLKFIQTQVPGVTLPYIYIGMMFATFGWHTEDQYMYSINYNHLGDGKRWYGIPSHHASAFESVMKSTNPELFKAQPDLLFQLVTMLPPGLLRRANVDVYTTVQNEGDFVVTFPRAYHGGFSNGFNVCTAVNFALAPWLEWGRKALTRYRMFRRPLVFCQDELSYTVAQRKDLTPALARAVYSDLSKARVDELAMREHVKSEYPGLRTRVCGGHEREAFYTNHSAGDDDKVSCTVCKQQCFFSIVECMSCRGGTRGCLWHISEMCDCSDASKQLVIVHTIEDVDAVLWNASQQLG